MPGWDGSDVVIEAAEDGFRAPQIGVSGTSVWVRIAAVLCMMRTSGCPDRNPTCQQRRFAPTRETSFAGASMRAVVPIELHQWATWRDSPKITFR